MKFSSLQKSGGVAIIAGSTLFAVWAICWTTILPIGAIPKDFSLLVLNPNWIWISSLALPGLILMIFGFTAIYARLYKDAGISGFLGYVFITIAYILETAKVTWEAFVYPAIVSHPASIVLLKDRIIYNHPQVVIFKGIVNVAILIGVVLFCRMLIQSKDFPKISGVLFFVGAVIYAVCASINMYLCILGVLIFSAGCFILGQRMFSTKSF